jgi:hypothetical protein
MVGMVIAQPPEQIDKGMWTMEDDKTEYRSIAVDERGPASRNDNFPRRLYRRIFGDMSRSMAFASTAATIVALFLVVQLLVGGVMGLDSSRRDPLYFMKENVAATGDEYLIGAGKADITG